MVLYIFAGILSKLIEIIFHLSPASLVFYLTSLTLLIIYTLLLSTMKRYISLYIRAILTKKKRRVLLHRLIVLEGQILNFKANIITNLITLLNFLPKYFLNAKNVLYVVKKVISLQITYNKSVITQKSILTTIFQSIKAGLVMTVICKNI